MSLRWLFLFLALPWTAAAVPPASGAAAQETAPASAFAVVSIQPLAPNHALVPNPGGPYKPGGEYSDPNVTVFELLSQAYQLMPEFIDLRALPGWARTIQYSIDAKPASGFPDLPPNENRRQISLMLQAMLADRFHLVVHHETRRSPVYGMVLVKKTLQNATPGDPSHQVGGFGFVATDTIVRLVGRNENMGDLADVIGRLFGRPTLDETGLKGAYNFDVRLQAPDTGATGSEMVGCGAACQGLMLSLLRDQLGIKLRATTAPVDFLVVDRIDKPTPN